MKKVGIIKRVLCISLVFLLNINALAAVVSDNDGSAFITKAEFDSLKNNFQSQIDAYNTSIDSKIDGAIASYLSGIKVSTKKNAEPLDVSYDFIKQPTYTNYLPGYYIDWWGAVRFSGVALYGSLSSSTATSVTDTHTNMWSYTPDCSSDAKEVGKPLYDSSYFLNTQTIDSVRYLQSIDMVKFGTKLYIKTAPTNSHSSTAHPYFDFVLNYDKSINCIYFEIAVYYSYSGASPTTRSSMGDLYSKMLYTVPNSYDKWGKSYLAGIYDSSTTKSYLRYNKESGDFDMTNHAVGYGYTNTTWPYDLWPGTTNNKMCGIYYIASRETPAWQDRPSKTVMEMFSMPAFLESNKITLLDVKSNKLRQLGYTNKSLFCGAPIVKGLDKCTLKVKVTTTGSGNNSFVVSSHEFLDSTAPTTSTDIELSMDENFSSTVTQITTTGNTTKTFYVKVPSGVTELWFKPINEVECTYKFSDMIMNFE